MSARTSTTAPTPNAAKQSVLGAFDVHRDTVLADADFRNLELWAEDEEARTKKDDTADDYAVTDDFELDDSIRYIPLAVRASLGDFWDRIRCRKFYRIEGDKFYYVRTVSTTRRHSVCEMCTHEGKPYIIKRIPLHEPDDLIKVRALFRKKERPSS